jgi:hypothetical protein
MSTLQVQHLHLFAVIDVVRFAAEMRREACSIRLGTGQNEVSTLPTDLRSVDREVE